MSDTSGFRRALVLMTATSLLVPLVGVITAPILAQALGVEGRGEAAAAMAPNALVASVATLGLPEALTFLLAKRAYATRRALAWSSLFSAVLGALCFVATMFAVDFLSGGDPQLGELILLGTALAIPFLAVNLLRGAASGLQMWGSVAIERALNSFLRLGALIVLALIGELNVLTAVLVMSIAPVIAGIAYWRLLLRPAPREHGVEPISLAPALLGYGSRIWLGAVASMLTGRLGQLLVTPLSDTQQLGLLVVAITISDVPFIVATALRDALFGVNSKDADAARLAATSRIATLVGFAGSLVIALTLPLWIGIIFGRDFVDATGVTWLLLAAAVANIPGLIAGAGLGAWARPGLRSAGLLVALISNLVAFVILVPPYGATGAGIAGLISGVLTSIFAVVSASRVLQVPSHAFLVPQRSDFVLLGTEFGGILRRFRRKR